MEFFSGMGFSPEVVQRALERTNFDKTAALEMILSENEPAPKQTPLIIPQPRKSKFHILLSSATCRICVQCKLCTENGNGCRKNRVSDIGCACGCGFGSGGCKQCGQCIKCIESNVSPNCNGPPPGVTLSLNEKNSKELIRAASNHDKTRCGFLVEDGADVNSFNDQLRTALHQCR